MSQSLVSFRDVSRDFRAIDGTVSVLKDINFEVEPGSFTIIYGPSGSGKTTILNMILGLLPPTKGDVTVAGQDLYNLSQDGRAKFRAAHYGVVSQVNNWILSMNVQENVALPLYLSGTPRHEALKKAAVSIERVGLAKYMRYNPAVLSVGQQQRISMARATVKTPQLLIADEPTGNLDTTNGDMIMQLMTGFRNHDNTTVILVTHNLDYLSLSSHRLFLKDGVLSIDEGGYQSEAERRRMLMTSFLEVNKTAEAAPAKVSVKAPVKRSLKKGGKRGRT